MSAQTPTPDDDAQDQEQNATPMNDLTGFQRDLLRAIEVLDGPKGLEIKSYLEPHYGEQIYHGHLYPVLDALRDKGLIDKRVNEPDKRSNCYTLTEAGRERLDAHRAWFGVDGS